MTFFLALHQPNLPRQELLHHSGFDFRVQGELILSFGFLLVRFLLA